MMENLFGVDAIVHCIEAMPYHWCEPVDTANKLEWQDHFIVTKIAISDSTVLHFFQMWKKKLGWNIGGWEIAISIKQDTYTKRCHSHDSMPLLSFHVDQNSLIDLLSVDAEGYNFEVLLGASETLRRARCLLFEYLDVGVWQHHTLLSFIYILHDISYFPFGTRDFFFSRTSFFWLVTPF
jgi:hypothetical protein